MPPCNKQIDEHGPDLANPQEGSTDRAMYLLCVHNIQEWYSYRFDLVDKLIQKSINDTGDIDWFMQDPVCVMVLLDHYFYADGSSFPSQDAERELLLRLTEYAEEKGILVNSSKLDTFRNARLDAIDTDRAGWSHDELKAVGELVEFGESVIKLVLQFYDATQATAEQRERALDTLGIVDRMVTKWQYVMYKAFMQTPSFPLELPVAVPVAVPAVPAAASVSD